MAAATTIDLTAQDATGQHRVKVRGVPIEATVREVMASLLEKMGLVQKDASGKPLEYRALRDSEGRHLVDSEIVGDALEPGDNLVLQPRINAGIHTGDKAMHVDAAPFRASGRDLARGVRHALEA